MNSAQFDLVLEQLVRIANALEGGAIHPVKPQGTGEVPTNPYASPDLPAGYDTALGYFARVNPHAVDLLGDPVADTQRDGFWLTHQASRRGIRVTKVEAPAPMQELGITEVNAYPVELLAERFGD